MAKAKKAIAFFLVLAMFTCSFLSVSAQSTNSADNPLVCYENTDSIQPRITYFKSVFCGISLKNGNVVGTGDYTSLSDGIDVTFIIAIEKQSGSAWKQVQATSRTYSPGKGVNILSTTYKNPSSGNYRALATALAVKNGVIVESVKVYSRTVTV